jgi:hypothetical protein
MAATSQPPTAPEHIAGGSPSESDMSDRKRGPGRPRSAETTSCISLRFPAAEINRLRQVCDQRGTNPSRVAGELLAKWFRRQTRKES